MPQIIQKMYYDSESKNWGRKPTQGQIEDKRHTKYLFIIYILDDHGWRREAEGSKQGRDEEARALHVLYCMYVCSCNIRLHNLKTSLKGSCLRKTVENLIYETLMNLAQCTTYLQIYSCLTVRLE